MERFTERWPLAVVAAIGLGGCAETQVLHERGWLGGRYADAPIAGAASAEGGALVVGAWGGTPAAAAGLVPGDLVVAVDGTPVRSPRDLRREFEGRAPGSTAALSVWRNGSTEVAPVVVGREAWQRTGTLRLGFGLSSKLDLWPFDDGFDLLGLVAFRVHRRDPDLAGPEATFARAASPDAAAPTAAGDGWDAWLAVVGVGLADQVTSEIR